MKHLHLDEDYWRERYHLNDTPWDTGAITTPIKNFVDQLDDRQLHILIPGAGKAHEAIYLHQKGFKNVWVCDWAPEPLDLLRQQVPDFPEEHLICGDFFDLNLKVDLLLEQTFFCAIDPALRPSYVKKAAELLQDKGILAGLLFAQIFPFEGPPFGGTEAEYRQLFTPCFDIIEMAISRDSIKPRAGTELFVKMISKE